jgi:hypothetical protein
MKQTDSHGDIGVGGAAWIKGNASFAIFAVGITVLRAFNQRN